MKYGITFLHHYLIDFDFPANIKQENILKLAR